MLRSASHPLAFEQLYTVESHEEHLQAVTYLAKAKRLAVVIAASGMCSGGRVVNYPKSLLGDARHDVLFVAYQAAGTPGGYLAHADQANLLRFVKGIRHRPREIRLVHGMIRQSVSLVSS